MARLGAARQIEGHVVNVDVATHLARDRGLAASCHVRATSRRRGGFSDGGDALHRESIDYGEVCRAGGRGPQVSSHFGR
jgi:hypothetical protein